jgi:hypothetical protein
MKTINVVFTDKEHDEILVVKGVMSWHDFILDEAQKLTLFKEVKK